MEDPVTATLPPCACGHLQCLHIPAAASAGRCTGAGCDCRTYVRRTTLPDEHMQPLEESASTRDWNPTDDELREIARPGIDELDLTCDLARLVLREREGHIERGERLIVAASELIRLADARDKAEAERDQWAAQAQRLSEAIDRLKAERDQAELNEATYRQLADDRLAQALRMCTAVDNLKAECDELREYNRLLVEGNSACLKEAHDELDQARAALARVEALYQHPNGGTWPSVPSAKIRDAIAGDPPAAGYGADMGTSRPGQGESKLDGNSGPAAGCRIADVDGDPVLVHGATDWDDTTRAMFVEAARAAAPTEVHKPFTDDGVTYCGWDKHEGCGEVWPCSTVRAQAPTHLPLDEVIEIAADLARRAATPPEAKP